MSNKAETKLQKKVDTLKDNLREMPKAMYGFSLSMRSLYAENAVESNEKAAKEFRKLRDDTRNDAMVYLRDILPLITKFVRSISEYFEYYEALDYEEWSENLQDILDEVVGYRKHCEKLVKMHEEIMVPLKQREDQAKLVMKEFQELTKEFESKKAELKSKASNKRDWALALFIVPDVRLIATPLLSSLADEDLANTVAKGAEAKVQEAAAIIVIHTLIPALQCFIEGLSAAAGFFSDIEKELKTFKEKDGKGLEDTKKLHYNIINKEAKDIKDICQGFYAVLPAVRTDFAAIPKEGTDKNCVDERLVREGGEYHKRDVHS